MQLSTKLRKNYNINFNKKKNKTKNTVLYKHKKQNKKNIFVNWKNYLKKKNNIQKIINIHLHILYINYTILVMLTILVNILTKNTCLVKFKFKNILKIV